MTASRGRPLGVAALAAVCDDASHPQCGDDFSDESAFGVNGGLVGRLDHVVDGLHHDHSCV